MIVNPFRFGGGGGGGSTHRYWRIRITANDGSPVYNGFTEIELRGTPGGPDLTVPQANAQAATAISEINGANAAELAVDNNATTGWLSNGAGVGDWWRYDFGHPSAGSTTADIQQISIAGSWNVPSASPKDFTLQWSDDNSAWTTVMTVTGQTGWTGASDVRVFTV